MADTLQVVNNDGAHRFEARLGAEVAFAEYRLKDDAIILPHTVVPEAFEGKGVGSKLAQAALGYARDNGLKVIPLCPFMAGYITKHAEWHDLVHEDYRAKLGI